MLNALTNIPMEKFGLGRFSKPYQILSEFTACGRGPPFHGMPKLFVAIAFVFFVAGNFLHIAQVSLHVMIDEYLQRVITSAVMQLEEISIGRDEEVVRKVRIHRFHIEEFFQVSKDRMSIGPVDLDGLHDVNTPAARLLEFFDGTATFRNVDVGMVEGESQDFQRPRVDGMQMLQRFVEYFSVIFGHKNQRYVQK